MKAKFFYIDLELAISLICIYKVERRSLSEAFLYSPKKFKHKKLSKKFMISLMKTEVNTILAVDSESTIDDILKRRFVRDKINRKLIGELNF